MATEKHVHSDTHGPHATDISAYAHDDLQNMSVLSHLWRKQVSMEHGICDIDDPATPGVCANGECYCRNIADSSILCRAKQDGKR